MQEDVVKCIREASEIAVDVKRMAQRLIGMFLETLQIRMRPAEELIRQDLARNGMKMTEADRYKALHDAITEDERESLGFLCDKIVPKAAEIDQDDGTSPTGPPSQESQLKLSSTSLFASSCLTSSGIEARSMKGMSLHREHSGAIGRWSAFSRAFKERIDTSDALHLSPSSYQNTTVTSTLDFEGWMRFKNPVFIIKHVVANIDPMGVYNLKRRRVGHQGAIKLYSLYWINFHLQQVEDTKPKDYRSSCYIPTGSVVTDVSSQSASLQVERETGCEVQEGSGGGHAFRTDNNRRWSGLLP
ncbi:hypothetical protein EC957_012093 [Mortierella hygrophila]|uniref:Uncharacterized protein n=1 Tax=Mortierella hygrophila TaxID=979708 RepID=A0A9P6K3G0_9FUNG|nr:hypothetical protein EC957_012093 [Mortierella hygrophila]